MNFDISSLGNSTGVVIGGAVLVVVVAIFIFKSGSRKKKGMDTTATEREELPEVKDSSTRENKRSILKKIRSIKKPIFKEEAAVEPLGDFPPAIPTDILSIEEIIPEEPVISPIVNTGKSGNESTAGAVLPDIVDIPPETGNETKKPFEIPAKAKQDIPAPTEPPVEKEKAPPVKAEDTGTSKPKEDKKADDIFSMFTDEETEENESSKFAAKLAPVDINRLRRDAEDISKYIRR